VKFSGSARRQPAIALSALVLVKIIVLFGLAWNRRIVMDEFAQLGWAKYLGHGLFGTVWPSKSMGFAVFIKPAHLIGWDARSILLIGRMQTALLACGTLAMVYLTARALGQSRLRAAVVLLVLLSFSNFIERIFETRAEPLAVFFAVAALLVAVRGDGRKGHVLAAGVLSGFAFLSTQKSLYFDVALGLALVGDAAIGRRFADALTRGAWLVLGWLIPVIVYCFVFGGSDPLPVADNLIFGPLGVASPQTAAEYGGLRHFVIQTLLRNFLLYLFCFAGILIALLRIRRMDSPRRIALIFTVVITALVFAHNQPWPYVFVMALPFMALWSLQPFDALARYRVCLAVAWAVLGAAVALSFVRNARTYRIDNHGQLALVARAEALLGPGQTYFDGVGMLPNRPEPSTLWLDQHAVLQTLHDGKASEAYRIFSQQPPTLVLWSYRMDAIEPVVGPLIAHSYVQVAPNIRMAGARLVSGRPTFFIAPISGAYDLYSKNGDRLGGKITVDGAESRLPIMVGKGRTELLIQNPGGDSLLLPVGSYRGRISDGPDDRSLFDNVYK
jgi:hypothetical protein